MADEYVVSDMAAPACWLGFKSTKIMDLINESLNRLITKQALLGARKLDRFLYGPHVLDTLIDRIVGCSVAATPNHVDSS
jgi:hypothetical protein